MNVALPGAEGDECPPVPVPPGANPGLSLCLEQGRLKSGGRSLDVSIFDVDALRIVENALERRGPVLICPPDPFAPSSALVAATAHINAMVRSRVETGRAVASPLRVGVVSTDYRIRGFYRGLAVAPSRAASGEPLRSIVPAATLGAGGRISVIDGEDGRWSTVFVRSVAEAESLGALDLLVVDLPVFDSDRLHRITAPTVVIAKDPGDPAVTRLAETMPVFGYDGFLRDGDDPGGWESFPRLTNRRDQSVRVMPVTAPAVCTNAGLFCEDAATLVRLGRRSPYVAEVVRDAFGLFHDLLGLAMPVGAFAGLTGRPLEARVAALARAAEIVSDAELRADWLPMAEAELAGLLDALRVSDRDVHGYGRGNKATTLTAVVAEALDDRRDVVLIARTAVLARAYAEYLGDRGLGGVRVTSLGALAETRPGDLAVLLGMAPSWGTWVYRSGAGRELLVLAYTPDVPGTLSRHSGSPGDSAVEPYGSRFDEAEMVTSTVRRQADAGQRISAPAQRARSWKAVVNGTRPGPLVDWGIGGSDGGSGPALVPVPRPPEVPPGLWDGTGWMAPLEPESPDEPARTRDVDLNETAPGLRVTFTDGSWAWLNERSAVWRWRHHTAKAEQVDAAELTVGEKLVFIDGDAHKSLLAKILDVAEGVPQLALAAGWHGHWQAVLHRAYARFGSYTALRRALAELGCRVQAQTLRLWCVGVTIGPDDREDVRRLGRLMDDRALSGSHAEIWRAMQTLRNSHGAASRRLASLARALGPAAGTTRLPADEVIDPVSGLTAADLQSAVVLASVARIEPVATVPRVLAGRRRAADEPADILTSTTVIEELPS